MTFKRYRVVEYGALILIISMGTRQSFGIFLPEISRDLGIGRELFSLAIAVQNIIFGLPIVGVLADRYGSRWVAIGGGILYALGIFLLAVGQSPAMLFGSLGILVGIALSATSFVVVLGAAAQVVPAGRRTVMFGLLTAAGSIGMFAVVPALQWLLDLIGWVSTFYIMAGMALVISLLAIAFPAGRRSQEPGTTSAGEGEYEDEGIISILKKASGHSGYWLLTAGFFVCGFHVAFIATHLPAYLQDNGLSTQVSAFALAMIGLFNLIGSSSFGYLGDRYRKKYLLCFIYLGRAVVISAFIWLPLTATSAILFGAAIGSLWLATVPLTSGAVAHIFGSRYLSTLYGVVFFSHQIGAFLGVWLGGRVFDTLGSYQPIWIAGIILAVIAGLIHLPMIDTPVARRAVTAD
ncbi:MAG: MFS transporter [Ardenticatenaceae bacterium]|nr:MFS transporter [Ardenticatenaceae bacterium]